MRDLDERLRKLDLLDAPDLWPDVRVRDPRLTAEHPSRGRAMSVAVAILVAVGGIAFAASAFFQRGESSLLGPRTNGQIAFLVGNISPGVSNAQIHLVNPDGTGDQQVTRNLSVFPGMSWSRDGKRVAFVQGHGEGGPSNVFVIGSDGKGLRQLTRNDGHEQNSGPAWSPNGTQIAFSSDRAGVLPNGIHHFDIYVMNADGTDVRRVTTNPDIAEGPTWSPDGRRIAFLARRDGRWGIWMVGASGGAETLVLDCAQAGCHTPAPQWSPDGSRILFVGGDNDEIQTVEIDGQRLRTLYHCTAACAEVGEVVWSPDGRQIAFASTSGRVGDPWRLDVMNADGSSLRQIAHGCCPAWQPGLESSPAPIPSPSPTLGSPARSNGEIWARVGGGDGPSFVYSFQPDGSDKTLLFGDMRDPNSPPGTVNPEAVGEDYAWSPDGSRVAFLDYSGYDQTQGEHSAIFVMSPDGTGRIQLTSTGELDSGPSWSRDGSRIAYASDRQGPYPYVVGCWATTLCPADIYVVSSDGTGEVQLTSDPEDDSQPSWSPDGTKIAFKSARVDHGAGDIFVMNSDGTGVAQLSSGPAMDIQPRWSPDGSTIAFESYRDGAWNVYLMDPNGGGLRRLTDATTNGSPFSFDWSPDGTVLAYADDSGIYTIEPSGSGQTTISSERAGNIAWRPVP